MPWIDGKNSWLKDLDGKDPVADYRNLDVAGANGSLNSAIQSGELNDTPTDIIHWGGEFYNSRVGAPEKAGSSYVPGIDRPDELFALNINDRRYQACLRVAHKLKEQYPLAGLEPTKPDDYAEIVRREEKISTALNDKIHKEYGDYNKAVVKDIAKGINPEKEPTLHDDVFKATHAADGNGDVPRLSEFHKGELICRHYASLISNLLTEAGVANFEVTGNANDFSIKDDKVEPERSLTAPSAHAFVVSRLTGNVFEGTDRFTPYRQQISDISMKKFLGGATLVIGNEYYLSTYGTGSYDGKHGGTTIAIAAIDFATAKAINCLSVQPAMEKFNAAAKKGDAGLIAESCKEFSFSKRMLVDTLDEAIRKQNLAMSEFLIDHGALEGYDNSVRKIDIPFRIKDKEHLDPSFVRGLASKLGISKRECLVRAKELGCSEQYHAAFQSAAKPILNPDTLKQVQEQGASLSPYIKAPQDVSHTTTNYVPANVSLGTSPSLPVPKWP